MLRPQQMLKRVLERSRRKLWYGPIRVEGVQVMIPLVPENPGSSKQLDLRATGFF